MSERKELNDDLLNDVSGGLSSTEVIDGVKRVASLYLDKRLNDSKVNLGILGEVNIGEAIETIGKALEDTDIKGLKDVGGIIKNIKPE